MADKRSLPFLQHRNAIKRLLAKGLPKASELARNPDTLTTLRTTSVVGAAASHSNLSDMPSQTNTDHDARYNPNFIAGSTYITARDFFNQFGSAGWISGGAITDNGDGTVAVAAGTGLIRSSDSENADLYFCDWAADDPISLTDDSENYIYVDYNSGSPQLAVTVTPADVRDNENNKFELYEVYRDGTTLHITDHRHAAGNFPGYQQMMIYDINRLWRANAVGGLILGESGDTNRHVTMTAGKVYVKVRASTIAAFDSSGADRFTTYYRDGGGGWTATASVQQWPNTQYDNGSGTLQDMTGNFYSAIYFYIQSDGDLAMLYGWAQYATLAQAVDDSPPSSVPDILEEHALLIGRYVYKKSATTPINIESAFTVSFNNAGVTDHGDLAGLGDDDHTQYILASGTRPFAIGSDADGDIWYRSSGAIARLAKGTAGQHLAMNSGATAPEWVAPIIHRQVYSLVHVNGLNGTSSDETDMNCSSNASATFGGTDGTTVAHYGVTGYDFTNHKVVADYTSLAILNKGQTLIDDPWVGTVDNSGQIAFWVPIRKKGSSVTVEARIKRSGTSATSDAMTTLYLGVSDQDGGHDDSVSQLVSAVGTSWETMTTTAVDISAYDEEFEMFIEMSTSAYAPAAAGAFNETSTILVHEIIVTQY